MSRTPQPVEPHRAAPTVVIVILVLRVAVFAVTVGLAAALLISGQDLGAVSSAVSGLVTAAVAAACVLTGRLGLGQLGVGRPGIRRPGIGRPGIGRPGIGRPGVGRVVR
ncbi:hypothetical protein [Kribbella solani]|uniref:hypothetical protein n=1 Tax=Kribbella solani TaxID=236067 RepID=UPI0029B983A7|nr:hypothetical protein [Kribbella solani]MDX2971939.1 hypothetical protein [Kribbella solani]